MPKLEDIQIRDPFVLVADGRYHLFGSTDPNIWSGPATGFDTYVSDDLVEWSGPEPAFRPAPDFWSHTEYWAPEVHAYDGAYFMFATFVAPGVHRGTQVLRSPSPEGPFEPWSDGPLTPADWECLDGTLFVEDGQPWMVFCHEWKDTIDGEIRAVRLTPDLRGTIGEPELLFTASEAPWARHFEHHAVPEGELPYVTDGCFLHRTTAGRLLMLWSSFGDGGYALGVATSASGRLEGPWLQEDEPLFPQDGGHGMIFRALDGRLLLTLHQPNDTPNERARFFEIRETDDGLRLTAG
jgi:arabinan endo-1,5-alpha-L-arabinosidase